MPELPLAEIIAVGSEMLTPSKVDTNSLWLTNELNQLGVQVVRKSVVADDRLRLAETIRAALSPGRTLIITGGLGPTQDDVTREATADALGRGQSRSEEVLRWLEERFRRFGRTMAEVNKRQADVIDGSQILPNPNGTAPGQWLEHEGAAIVLLPGPPHELKPMFENEVKPRLRARLPKSVVKTLFYRVAGMGESDLDQLIAPVYTQYKNPATTILAAAGDIQVLLSAQCAEEAEADQLLFHDLGPKIEALLGDCIYSRDGSPLEVVIARMLPAGARVAVAESCTGGMLAQRITSVPGRSAYFAGGFVTYTNEMKTALLGVDPALIEQHTAVSDPVARAMAAGALERTRSTYALSATGVAGPDGGTEENPVGTVFIGLAGPSGTDARRFRFPGDRTRIRGFAVQAALDMLRRRLRS